MVNGVIGKCDMGNTNHKNRIRRYGGNIVGGDPVGSTDPEVILWGPQILRCQGIPSLHQIGL